MTSKFRKWCVILIVFAFAWKGWCEEDTLGSALKAIDRKQRDLSDYSRNGEFYSESGYGFDADENFDFAYLKKNPNYSRDPKFKNPVYQQAILDYLEIDDEPSDMGSDANRRISSSFRERVEEDKARQREKMTVLMLNKLQKNQNAEDINRYEKLLQLWENYNSNPNRFDYTSRQYSTNGMNKRDFASFIPFGKRGRHSEPEDPSETYHYLYPRDEIFDRWQEDFDRSDYDMVNQYASSKRFPVKKRSSDYYPVNGHHHKRSSKKEKTDPRVVKDLSNIFSPKFKRSNGEEKKKVEPVKTPDVNITNIDTVKEELPKPKSSVPPTVPATEFPFLPLHFEKKSVNWSDYFGLDRRKKSDDIDNEWLVERYHKAVKLAEKRDGKKLKQPLKGSNKTEFNLDEIKIGEMDEKLKIIEDSIVDRTLKYTGAHEGPLDSKEIQEVKDKVIAQLAAAYSLEKMRRALGEYKKNVQNQRNRMRDPSDSHSEEKRVSVPRKSAYDQGIEKMIDAENKIRCTTEDCIEQNYGVPKDLLDEADWDKERCPKVQRACNAVASALGYYGRSFESACAIHQKCLLCGDNRWFSPTRQCNVLFLSKADEMCDNDVECQRVARNSIRYLIDVNRSLKADPMEICNLVCPEKWR